jgi:3-oxoadipate CoA-transferase alpha subunit
MIDKVASSPAEALGEVPDGATVLVGGFGEVGAPTALLAALLNSGATDLTLIANNAGVGETGIAGLLKAGRVRKVVCSYPRSTGSVWFERRYLAGEVELEVVPQGTLAERIRAAGAGLGAFYTPTGVDTELAVGKEVREFQGRRQVLELALHADIALVRGDRGDRWGNLVYHATARNFAPVMATAGRRTVAEISTLVPLGALDCEGVVTPGIYVDAVVVTGRADS